MSKGKTVALVAVVVVVGAGGFLGRRWREAQKDTARITTRVETKQTAASVENALAKPAGDFGEASAAIRSSGMLEADKQVELLGKQLDAPNPATRLATVTELAKLVDKGNAKAAELLTGAAAKESDADVRVAVEGALARRELAAAAPADRAAAVARLAADKRAGYRVVAVAEFAAAATPEAKAQLATLAKDSDENVQIAAEEALANAK